MTDSPRDRETISFSPEANTFCMILDMAWSTNSAGTGLLCKALEKDCFNQIQSKSIKVNQNSINIHQNSATIRSNQSKSNQHPIENHSNSIEIPSLEVELARIRMLIPIYF